jgi:ABC-2 type transport system ATP-binding protein
MSSHLLSEADRTAADVLVVGRGSLRYAGPLDGLTGPGVSLEDAFLDLTTEAAS